MKIVFRRRPAEVFFSKENHQMKAGHNNKYDSTKTCSLVQVCMQEAQKGIVGI